ncbi:MAG: hypothetical protein LBM75_03505 [Myxococcales bacterium]|jgi:hypothetical protein|nr:hypothetical protein [Myxococcales bacterium]
MNESIALDAVGAITLVGLVVWLRLANQEEAQARELAASPMPGPPRPALFCSSFQRAIRFGRPRSRWI